MHWILNVLSLCNGLFEYQNHPSQGVFPLMIHFISYEASMPAKQLLFLTTV